MTTSGRAISDSFTFQRATRLGGRALLAGRGSPQALYQRARRRYAGSPRLALELVSAMLRWKAHGGAEPQLNVLALNSGCSSLKFALYRVGVSRIERLLPGEAASIGDKSGKCHAEDSLGNVLFSETGAIPSQREAITDSATAFATAFERPRAQNLTSPAACGSTTIRAGALRSFSGKPFVVLQTYR